MRIITWNVNGLNSRLKYGFWEMVDKYQPDILCLQETKVHHSLLPIDMDLAFRSYDIFWDSGSGSMRKHGVCSIFRSDYRLIDITVETIASTSIFSKDASVLEILSEGRLSILRNGDDVFLNVYSPTAGSRLENLDKRILWDTLLFQILESLHKSNLKVILCGDLNVLNTSVDNAKPYPGQSKTEIESFHQIVDLGYVDIFDQVGFGELYEGDDDLNSHYQRLDYILINSLDDNIETFTISNRYGSDHFPIGVDLPKIKGTL